MTRGAGTSGTSSGIRRFGPRDLRPDTAQTKGMWRAAALDREGLWSGLVRTAPGTTSDWHHHGEYESVIYVAEGAVRLEYGAKGGEQVEAHSGDFVLVPKGTVHRESNPSTRESVLVITRAGTGPTVINTEGPSES